MESNIKQTLLTKQYQQVHKCNYKSIEKVLVIPVKNMTEEEVITIVDI